MINKKENFKQPELNTEEAIEIINNLKFEGGEDFSYREISFHLIFRTQEDVDSDEDKLDAFFSRSTVTDGFDIYLLDSLSLEEKKRRVFHEIIEVSLLVQGFFDTAHNLALEAEIKVYGERK